MKTSESIKEIASALVAAQKQMEKAKKGTENKFLKSNYADLEDVIDAVKPSLNDNGIIYIQTFTHSQPNYLNLVTRLIHVSGEYIEDEMMMPLVKTDPQSFGSAGTYARRYSLAAICGLSQTDDDAQDATKIAKKKNPSITGARFNSALESIKSGKYSVEKLNDNFDLTDDQKSMLDNLVIELKDKK